MSSIHAKRLKVSKTSFDKMKEHFEGGTYKYNAKRGTGYLLDKDLAGFFDMKPRVGVMVGKFMYLQTYKAQGVDRNTLEPEEKKVEVTKRVDFEINLNKQLIIVDEKSADIDKLLDEAEGMADVGFLAETFDVDVIEHFKALEELSPKNALELTSIRIVDYQGREGLIATGNFKLLETAKRDAIFKTHQDSARAYTATIETEEGPQNITVTSRGSVRYSQDFPENLLEAAVGSLPAFQREEAEE